jgi:hypothetical protein
MCFSLQVSLTASALLFSIGILCLKKNPKKILAYIPFIFAIQQMAEALVWASFDYGWGQKWSNIFSYLFLFFAYVVWPTLIPYSFCQVENEKKRQEFLSIIFFVGIFISLYLFYHLIIFQLSVKIIYSRIEYYFQSINDNIYLFLAYTVTVIAPSFVSSNSRAKMLGILIFVAWAASILIYLYAFTSVWCFFAAILSSVIYFLL